MNTTRNFQKLLSTLFVSVSLLETAFAQKDGVPPPAAPTAPTAPTNPMIYPARGQSQEQLEKDKAEAHAWATQQTGYDPVAAAVRSQQNKGSQQIVLSNQPAPPQPRGGVL